MVKADQTLSLLPVGGVSETMWKPILCSGHVEF